MTTSAPRGCSTSWPSRARTLPSSPGARFCSPGSWGFLAGSGELGALAAIGGYVLAVGWQPSIVRAGVAGALASLAWLAARPRDRWYFLLVGAAVLLAWNPYSLLEPGFQLSFGAVGAIFIGVPPLERRLEGYPAPRWLRAVIAVSVACGVATAPILLAALRLRPDLLGVRQRPGGACGRTTARARFRRGRGRARAALARCGSRMGERLVGRVPRGVRPCRSGVFRTRRSRLQLRQSALPQSPRSAS